MRLRFSEVNPGQVTGYAVTLPGHADSQGRPLWYSSGRLSGDLTLPRLRRRWGAHPAAGAERSSADPAQPATFRFTTAERDAIYGHAARQAALAAERVRRSAERDPGAAADAAWAAADTLHVAASQLGSRVLRRAADAYDRAARAPYGRVPGRTRDGDRLRRAASLMALTGTVTGGATLVTVALIASLVALAAAVAELRQAQHHAAQAAAARAAAEHLRAAEAGARLLVPDSGQAATPSPAARPATAANVAHRDGPAAPQPAVPGPAVPRPRRSLAG